MAVGVVVGSALPEVAEPADELGGIRPQEVQDRQAAPERRRRVGERRTRDTLEVRRLAQQLDEVVLLARAADEQPQVVDRRARVAHQRAQRAEERDEPRGDRLGRVDQRIEVVERRAQVDEGGVRAAQRRSEQLEVAVEGRLLVADGLRRGVGVGDEVGEVVAARGQRRRRLRAVAQQRLERALVAREL